MYLLKIIVSIIVIVQHFFIFASQGLGNKIVSNIHDNCFSECAEQVLDKNNLIVEWYPSEPYQFGYITKDGKYDITGLDIEIINAVSNKVDISIKYVESGWEQSILKIQNGKSDMVAAASYTKEREVYANFSVPYRFEEISLFALSSTKKPINFNNINEFLAQIRLLNFRLGITKKFIYGDTKITDYLNQASNNDIIIKYEDTADLLGALTRKEIDGFLADRISGIGLALGYTKELIQEIPTGLKTPIHFMFSKKTVSIDVVKQFNDTITLFVNTDEYKKIVKNYIYHVLLPKTINSEWSYIIGLIGGVAFALSGISLAVKKNATLFDTFLLAMLPSILGCVLLDITACNTSNITLILTPYYIYYIFITVLIGFSIVKLLDHYNKQLYEDSFMQKIWGNILIICDALGQSSFMIIGVVTVIVQRIEPLEFWGPCFACLTSSAGMILRNLICNNASTNRCILKDINFEVSILWGFIFSILLDIYAYNPNYNTIKYSIITSIAGAFVTRFIIYYYNIPNLTFRTDIPEISTK